MEGQLVSPEVGNTKTLRNSYNVLEWYRRWDFYSILTTGAGIGTMLWEISNGMVDQRFLVLFMYGRLLAGGAIPHDSECGCDGNDRRSTCADLALDFQHHCLHNFAPIWSKPFYHFAAGRFRQRMQEQQAEDLRRKRDSREIKMSENQPHFYRGCFSVAPNVRLDDTPLPLFSSLI